MPPKRRDRDLDYFQDDETPLLQGSERRTKQTSFQSPQAREVHEAGTHSNGRVVVSVPESGVSSNAQIMMKSITRFKQRALIRFDIGLWQSRIKLIEGHFGTTVATYYRLLRFLFYLNFVTALLSIGLIIIPQATHGFVPNPSSHFEFQNLFLGDGYLADSPLFFYAYSSGKLKGNYNLPFAYFMSFFISILIALFAIVRRMTKTTVEQSQKTLSTVPYSTALFGTYDFSVREAQRVVEEKTSLLLHLLEQLNQAQTTKIVLTTGLIIIRIIINIIILGILAGSMVFVFWLTEVTSNASSNSANGSIYPSLTVTLLNTILPFVFQFLATFERWETQKFSFLLTLTRSYALRMIGIYVLIISLFRKQTTGSCWGVLVGQQIYRLLITDFIISTLLALIIDGIRKFIEARGYFCGCDKRDDKGFREFPLSKNVLQAIYRQTLLWVGMFFSPILPAVGCLLFALVFYVLQWSMLKFLAPPSKLFRATNTTNFYMRLLFVSFFLGVLPVMYSIVAKDPSCGPFTSYKHIYDVLPQTIATWPEVLRVIFQYIGTPAVLGPLILFLIVIAYYNYRKSQGRLLLIRHLQESLLEATSPQLRA